MSAMNFVHFASYDPTGDPSLTCTPGMRISVMKVTQHMNSNDVALETGVPKYVRYVVFRYHVTK